MSVFHSIGFIMTNKCSAACAVCCFFCRPENNALLDKEMMKDYIRQAHEMGIKTASFSGGEAILYYDQLKECVAYAHGLGMNATLVTNGFWARNEKRGLTMMRALAEAGLRDVSISVDGFHQEYVSYETAARALRICERLGIATSITIMETADGRHVREALTNLRGTLYNRNVLIYPVLPAGNAANTVPDELIIRECVAETAVCSFDKGITVMYDGTIQMCCSQFSQEIGVVRLGHIGETSLADAVAAFHGNDFIYVLLKKQFKWYIEMAREADFPIAERYSVPCELCHAMFTDEDLMEYLRPRVKLEADRLRLEKLLSGNDG